eukprot:GHVS01074292.1.p1 GENE.GHVS01074292.1~~GHVS01074292.1.p1  ORF type:complete len:123 (-),score=4.70 GHVS01074292.1:528-896(-)
MIWTRSFYMCFLGPMASSDTTLEEKGVKKALRRFQRFGELHKGKPHSFPIDVKSLSATFSTGVDFYLEHSNLEESGVKASTTSLGFLWTTSRTGKASDVQAEEVSELLVPGKGSMFASRLPR